jgi:hypothetical protein
LIDFSQLFAFAIAAGEFVRRGPDRKKKPHTAPLLLSLQGSKIAQKDQAGVKGLA